MTSYFTDGEILTVPTTGCKHYFQAQLASDVDKDEMETGSFNNPVRRQTLALVLDTGISFCKTPRQ